ncbi:MAG TPA: hypothetical protein VK211_08860 [Kamptonema sp.]|nr:hypothetical protein [Kamptonema sp.]
MKNKPVKDYALALKFNNELKLENPEDFNLTPEQTKYLEAQLALLVEGAKTGTNLLVVRKIQ